MRCPFCNFEDTKVVDSRSIDGKKRRRRECTNCGKRFTTYEAVEMPVLLVVKRDNSVELFDRNKLIKGLSSAVKKRPVSIEDVNRIVDSVESCYANNMQNQITSAEIGDIVLKSLKEMDQVAYVRFASVYKDFSDVESFINIISELKGE
ncbi:MAG: transcriptional repressor NrdR [Oscillospiraceae bacterium]|nr:transcriptional repressor NrdR [Oscillospiraceae bacterium]MBQ5318042.1 transcriptional repressor NrdR [Oscillospiraceae bacterium]